MKVQQAVKLILDSTAKYNCVVKLEKLSTLENIQSINNIECLLIE